MGTVQNRFLHSLQAFVAGVELHPLHMTVRRAPGCSTANQDECPVTAVLLHSRSWLLHASRLRTTETICDSNAVSRTPGKDSSHESFGRSCARWMKHTTQALCSVRCSWLRALVQTPSWHLLVFYAGVRGTRPRIIPGHGIFRPNCFLRPETHLRFRMKNCS